MLKEELQARANLREEVTALFLDVFASFGDLIQYSVRYSLVYPHEWPRWTDPFWSNWALIVISVLAVLAALRTLEAIREQNKTNKLAAEAAQRSADAVMDADRALILILWDNTIHINPEAPNGVLSHAFQWRFQNVGKSPAFIERISSRFIALETLDDLPPEPEYLFPKELIFESEPLLARKIFGPIYSPMEGALPFDELERKHRSKKRFLYAYGFVQYRDTYRRLHETRFGLTYESAPTLRIEYDRFHLAGPPAYNSYT
jgi:type II secretory pathway pseudopilin PulG